MSHPKDFVTSTVNLSSEGAKIVNDENPNWKRMIPGNMKEGIIFEDSSISVNGKFNFTKYDGRIILELQTKGAELSNILVSHKIPSSFKMQVSDVMMPQNFGELPKVMIRCILLEKCTECPKIAFRFT